MKMTMAEEGDEEVVIAIIDCSNCRAVVSYYYYVFHRGGAQTPLKTRTAAAPAKIKIDLS